MRRQANKTPSEIIYNIIIINRNAGGKNELSLEEAHSRSAVRDDDITAHPGDGKRGSRAEQRGRDSRSLSRRQP